MKEATHSIDEYISFEARLCAACGMCCNGVLFHGTGLEPTDSIRALSALGLRLKRRDGQMQFQQPCPAWKGTCCGIYDKRPQRCRDFSCRQLQNWKDGQLSEEAAFAKIQEAKILTERVRGLFQKLGDFRENKPFATRYAGVFTPPLNPSLESEEFRSELSVAMKSLEELLAADFHREVQ